MMTVPQSLVRPRSHLEQVINPLTVTSLAFLSPPASAPTSRASTSARPNSTLPAIRMGNLRKYADTGGAGHMVWRPRRLVHSPGSIVLPPGYRNGGLPARAPGLDTTYVSRH